jgi:hypothetical protein
MKKIIFAALFFLTAAPLLLFQKTEDVLKNNQKLLRGVQGAPWHGGPIRDGFVAEDVFNNSTFTCNLHLAPLAEKSPPGPGRLYIALAVGYHVKSDQYFKQVYGNGTVNYTVEAGYWFIKNLALGIKLSYLNKKGKTLLLQSETSLRQIPVVGYLKAGFGLGRGWKGYGALGFGYIFFKEESYIGTIEESAPGWGLESGLEYSFTRKLYLLCAVGFQSFKKTFSELNETQQLGGVDIRLGIGIRVF